MKYSYLHYFIFLNVYCHINNKAILFYLGKKSRCKVNLNDARFMSIDEEILSNSDTETFYNTYDIQMNNTNITVDTSITSDIEQTEHFLNSFEITDSTSIASLPNGKAYTERFYIENVDLPQTLNNYHLQNDLRNQQDTNTIKRNNQINKHIPLKLLLRRMFDEILGHRTNSKKEMNKIHSNKTSIRKCSFKSCSSLNSEFDNRSNINNKDSTTISIMHMDDCNKNSNEDTASSYVHNSFDSGKYVSRLTILPLQKLKSKQSIDANIFITNYIIDIKDNTNSSIYSNIDITNEKCYSGMKIFSNISTNNEEYNEKLEMMGKESFIKTTSHSTETETNSSYSRFKEFDYSSSHEELSDKTASSCGTLEDSYKFGVKRTLMTKKKRSLSLPEENTEGLHFYCTFDIFNIAYIIQANYFLKVTMVRADRIQIV